MTLTTDTCVFQDRPGHYCGDKTFPGAIWCPQHKLRVEGEMDRRQRAWTKEQQAAADAQASDISDLDDQLAARLHREEIWEHRNDGSPEKAANDAVTRFEVAQREFQENAQRLGETLSGFQGGVIQVGQNGLTAPYLATQEVPVDGYSRQRQPRRRLRPGSIAGGVFTVVFCVIAAGFGYLIGNFFGAFVGGFVLGFTLDDWYLKPWMFVWSLGGLILGPVVLCSYIRGQDAYMGSLSPEERSDHLWRKAYQQRTRWWGRGRW